MKKRITVAVLFLVFVFCAGTLFTGCSYAKPFGSSELTPQTKICDYTEEYYEKWQKNNNAIILLDSYSDYINFGIDLGYTKAYFKNGRLIVVLKTGCSSDNLEFVDVLVDEGTLYPVFKINEYGSNDPVTDDIILFAFYAEVPIAENYNIGEVIIQTRQ